MTITHSLTLGRKQFMSLSQSLLQNTVPQECRTHIWYSICSINANNVLNNETIIQHLIFEIKSDEFEASKHNLGYNKYNFKLNFSGVINTSQKYFLLVVFLKTTENLIL
jgi:hypothetical protein